MKHTRFTCFASYKGGVGRSLSLANTAYVLAMEGKKVLIVDFDLEAPGQHQTDLFARNAAGSGLVELIADFRDHVRDAHRSGQEYEWPIERFIQQSLAFNDVAVELKNTSRRQQRKPSPGELWLMRAGALDERYYTILRSLDWQAFYEKDLGSLFFEGLKECLRELGFDEVLIDSRTGLGDILLISTVALADTVVLVTGLQRQHIEGLRRTLATITSSETEAAYGKKRVVLAASPVSDIDPSELRRRLEEIKADWPDFPGWEVEIPYVPSIFLREDVLSFKRDLLDLPNASVPVYVQKIEELRRLLDREPAESEQTHAPPTNPFNIIRTDYESASEWSRYFVDPGERIVEGVSAFMPSVVIGARGSGKTMLARQFSHETVLAQHRLQGQAVNMSSIERIGLYFRIDQDIIRAFDTRDDEAKEDLDHFFGQYLDIIILRKALQALDSLGGVNNWCCGRQESLFRRLFREFGDAAPLVQDLGAYLDFLEERLNEIRTFINNQKRVASPFRIQPNALMKILAEFLREAGTIDGKYFFIIIDEYENFRPYQQKIINARLKQSKASDHATYKFFVRTGGMRTWETLSSRQPIQDLHDFRTYKLDEGLDYNLFYEHLRKVANRHLENSSYFRRHGWTDVDKIFESLTREEEADLVAHGSAKKREKDELSEWVRRNHSPHVASTVLSWFKEEPVTLRKVTATVLVNQGKDPATVVREFRSGGKDYKGWYHNYSAGALFWLYRLYGKNKVYAGFSDIVGLSGFNIRTGLELCFAIIEKWLAKGDLALPISVGIQSEALKDRADQYRSLIRSSDSAYANRMVDFADRLGALLGVINQGPKQSEPEVNHFLIHGDVSSEVADFLEKCYLEEVLRRVPERKNKSSSDSRKDSWQLHPRLAPLYTYSWRLKKNVRLTADQLQDLCFGGNTEWLSLHNNFKGKYDKLGRSDDNRTLTLL